MATKRQQIQKALRAGDARARKVIRRRSAVLKKRAHVVETLPPRPKAIDTVAAKFVLAAGPPASAGVLIAEGDSWFDYPGADVLALLEDEHAFRVESVAHAGDRVEGMAYQDGQLDDFSRLIERIIRDGDAPRAILLSGGGNDFAGAQFEVLLDHASSPAPGFNARVIDGLVNQRVYFSYVTVIQAVTHLCQQKLGRTVPIIVHGYDYPVPDGRGFGWSWIPGLPGPWLEPGFMMKGYHTLEKRKSLIAELIDTFNTMVESLTRVPGFGHLRYVDLRNTLPRSPGSYKRWWANELHPTPTGFSAIAQKFADAI
jgi:hypothetical protein